MDVIARIPFEDKRTGQWYFYDEHWQSMGPYRDKEAAAADCTIYCDRVNAANAPVEDDDGAPPTLWD